MTINVSLKFNKLHKGITRKSISLYYNNAFSVVVYRLFKLKKDVFEFKTILNKQVSLPSHFMPRIQKATYYIYNSGFGKARFIMIFDGNRTSTECRDEKYRRTILKNIQRWQLGKHQVSAIKQRTIPILSNKELYYLSFFVDIQTLEKIKEDLLVNESVKNKWKPLQIKK